MAVMATPALSAGQRSFAPGTQERADESIGVTLPDMERPSRIGTVSLLATGRGLRASGPPEA